jgi:hypothetical protein
MKKVILSMIVLGGFLFLGTNVAEASEQVKVKKSEQTTQTTPSGFVDANNDGVCDNYDGVRPGQGKGPGYGKGLGQADGKGLGKGKGLCDGSGNGQRKLDGSGNGKNKGNGKQLRDGSGGNCVQPEK